MKPRAIALGEFTPGLALPFAKRLSEGMRQSGMSSLIIHIRSVAQDPQDPKTLLTKFEYLPPSLLKNYFSPSTESCAQTTFLVEEASHAGDVMALLRRSFDWCWVVFEELEIREMRWLESCDALLWIGSAEGAKAILNKENLLASHHFPKAFSHLISTEALPHASRDFAGISILATLPAAGSTLLYDAVIQMLCKKLCEEPSLYVFDQDRSSPKRIGQAVHSLRDKLQPQLLAALQASDAGPQTTAEVARQTLQRCLAEESDAAPNRQAREALYQQMVEDVLGLGPLEPLLKDPNVSEIMVNGPATLFVERHGKIEPCTARFENEDQLRAVIDRIVSPIGRRVDESTPLCDARLPDGSRVNIILPPLALDGPTVTIRKFGNRVLTLKDLREKGALDQPMEDFLTQAVNARKNIVVSGGTGSGKTTLLNALSGLIPDNERIVTIEDAAELRLQKPHVVRLESRPPNTEGEGAIPIRRLVMNALRMRPDRIVIGECRGGEALDMLQAMNTGHDGSLTTLHANTPRDALHRLETLVLMAGMDLPLRVVREQIRGAVHFILQQARFADGTRRIVSIAEITGMEGETLSLQEIFRYHPGRGYERCGTAQCMERAVCS